MAENKDNKELEQKLEQAEETKANESLNDNEADNKENADDASEKAAGKKDKRLTLAERKSRHGILATTSVIIVIAAVIALNLFLSSKEWNYDLTAEKVYTLSEQSKKIASSLTKDQEVTIYFLNKESKTYTTYKNILGQYEKAGKHIKVEYKDLELYPNFADDYVGEGQKAEADDMVIVCNDKHRFIKSSEYLSYSYNANNDATTTINMEPKITAAINYCISENTPIIYTLTGHGEQDLSSNMTEALETDNYDIKSLDVVQNGGIPSDGKLLIINAPSSDLGSSVIDMIDEYMENDGKLFVVIDPNNTYPNLNGLLAKYGACQQGLVR